MGANASTPVDKIADLPFSTFAETSHLLTLQNDARTTARAQLTKLQNEQTLALWRLSILADRAALLKLQRENLLPHLEKLTKRREREEYLLQRVKARGGHGVQHADFYMDWMHEQAKRLRAGLLWMRERNLSVAREVKREKGMVKAEYYGWYLGGTGGRDGDRAGS